MKKNRIISLIIIISLLITPFTSSFAEIFVAPSFEVDIVNVEEPVIGQEPNFNNSFNCYSSTGHSIEDSGMIYWLEYDESYNEILDYMSYTNSLFDMRYLLELASRVNYNKNSNIEAFGGPETSEIDKFQSNKTYLSIFVATYKEIEDENLNDDIYKPEIEASVNGKKSNVKAIVYSPSTTKNKGRKLAPFEPTGYIIVMSLYESSIPSQDLKATVNWENADDKIPESLTMKLMIGEEAIAQKIITKEDAVSPNSWECDFGEYPVFDMNGNQTTYSLAYEETNKGDLKFFNTTIDGFTITNTYEPPEIKSKVKMKSLVDRETNNVKYKIDYSASIKKYSGDADVTITTTLPFTVDENKSDLDKGTYDSKTHSITWKEKIENISEVYDYSTTKNIDLYATAVLPYEIEATTVGEVKLSEVEDFSESVNVTDVIETGTGNPKTGDNSLQKYLSISLIGIVTILIVISIKRKYSTRKTKIQY